MRNESSFDVADVQVERATTVKSEVMAALTKRAKNPVLVTGGRLLGDSRLVDYAVKIYDKEIPIIATGASSKPLIQRGVSVQSAVFTLHHITQYMLDREWMGFDNKGGYDVVLYLGIEPYLLSRMLSALKHFSEITTLSIDRFYQPHATYSFPNLFEDEHYSEIEKMIDNL
ncbi:MAG TPA: CO dehydrogenase/acetyl-CoA synthase complex subunit epsilon [Archaeoglobaceae archaeon]|nr:CO dehydrogenase/acetyl-CoA synthase complex subunit epsilon [Archaeoglobaceae archaeon]